MTQQQPRTHRSRASKRAHGRAGGMRTQTAAGTWLPSE